METQLTHQAVSDAVENQEKAGVLPLTFELPADLEAHEPPEARGLSRDGIRLMVSFIKSSRTVHVQFTDFPDFLQKGDAVVINTSKTIPAAVQADSAGRSSVEIHFSTHLPDDHWLVELRLPGPRGTQPYFSAQPGATYHLPGGASVTLVRPYRHNQSGSRDHVSSRVRLWVAEVHTPLTVERYLEQHGFPIKYQHVNRDWPLSYYQTVYGTDPGSAEMPSAGRPLTQPIIDQMKAKGVAVLPLLLHTGVSSMEGDELPPPEYFRVSEPTAQMINHAHMAGHRVIAVGTTVIRALESVTGLSGRVSTGEGWTELLVTPQGGIHSVDGLLTGFHDPRSTHLLMLEALTGHDHLVHAYTEALKHRYLWHEFGDVHLILP